VTEPASPRAEKWYARANESAFRPTAGGYVFQAPNPWMLARPRYHLVTEAQKAALLDGLSRWRLLLIIALLCNFAIIGALMVLMQVWPATFARPLVPLAQSLGPAGFVLLLCVALTLVMVPLLAIPQVYLAGALRPVLADAPLTDERIKMSEQLPKIATSVSRTVLVVGLIGAVVAIAGSLGAMADAYLEGHLVRSAAGMLLVFLGGVVGTAYFAYLLRLKAKQKQAVAS
jgi:hypothetical protein